MRRSTDRRSAPPRFAQGWMMRPKLHPERRTELSGRLNPNPPGTEIGSRSLSWARVAERAESPLVSLVRLVAWAGVTWSR